MASIYGAQRCEKEGEKLVCEALRTLPDDWIVYAQPVLVHKDEQRYPDFVVVGRDLGLAVLEVKDWATIGRSTPDSVEVWDKQKQDYRTEPPPHQQARQAAFVIVNKLQEDPILVHHAGNHQGKLVFPYHYAGILPFQPRSTISQLSKVWGEGCILGESDIKENRIEDALRNIPPKRNFAPLSDRQMDAIRAAINPELIITDQVTGAFKGILDELQEKIIQEPLTLLDQQTEKLNKQLGDNIRLIRGPAGTGKTDILILRAKRLAKEYPEKKILVTTYNKPLLEEKLKRHLNNLPNITIKTFDKLCTELFKKIYPWARPQGLRGVVARLATKGNSPLRDLINQYGIDFVLDEIQWMKEIGRTNREDYINLPREGRGGLSETTLGKTQKEEIFKIFEAYQACIQNTCVDWIDVRNKVWEFIVQGQLIPAQKYDAIFIDEVQHFAPRWMDIIKAFMSDQYSYLFLCEDPSQSVFRYYSWKQKGIEVRGRTKWLKKPYRTTQQIFRAAYELIKNDAIALEKSEWGTLDEIDDTAMRQGVKPQIIQFPDKQTEIQCIISSIKRLKNKYPPKSIAVLHTKDYVLSNQDLLNSGAVVDSALRQTGMEYHVVFIPDLKNLFDRDVKIELEEDERRQRLAMYMLMTRARDLLYLCYRDKFPKLFDAIKPYTDIIHWNNFVVPDGN